MQFLSFFPSNRINTYAHTLHPFDDDISTIPTRLPAQVCHHQIVKVSIKKKMPSAIHIHQPTQAGPLSWSGTTTKSLLRQYILSIDAADVEDIKAALEFWKNGMNISPASVTKETFPLPSLASRLNDLALNLHTGSGFAVVRGLDTRDFSDEDNLLIYLGISSWIGSQRGKYTI